MKYEKPELTALTDAITAVKANKPFGDSLDDDMEIVAAYADWED